jgi:hypothetical protein
MVHGLEREQEVAFIRSSARTSNAGESMRLIDFA